MGKPNSSRSRAGGLTPMALAAPPDLLPRWEGTPGFDAVGRALGQLLTLPAMSRTTSGIDVVSGAELIAFQAIAAMRHAHPIYIGPRQLEMLPPWSEDDAWEDIDMALRYAAALNLPFDPLFLDFTAEDGHPCWLEGRLALFGALLFRGREAVPGALVDDGQLALIPFGAVTREADRTGVSVPWALPEKIAMPFQAPIGALLIGGSRLRADGELWLCEWGMAGAAGHDRSPRMLTLATALPTELVGPIIGERYGERFATAARVYAGTGSTMEPLIGAFTPEQPGRIPLEALLPRFERDAIAAIAEAAMVRLLATYALRAMYLLESNNVELAPAPVSRQVRRAAQRSSGRTRIALTVTVRTARRSTRPKAGSGGKREFAYAFERGGHYRHVTRGRHATPQHMRPCPRDDEAHRASGGRCRREWIPPHIVGAGEGKPLVIKARHLVEPHPEDARCDGPAAIGGER